MKEKLIDFFKYASLKLVAMKKARNGNREKKE